MEFWAGDAAGLRSAAPRAVHGLCLRFAFPNRSLIGPSARDTRSNGFPFRKGRPFRPTSSDLPEITRTNPCRLDESSLGECRNERETSWPDFGHPDRRSGCHRSERRGPRAACSDGLDRPVRYKSAGAGGAGRRGDCPARRDGRLYVFRVLPGSPAALSGNIHAGDRLVAVGQGNQPAVDVNRMSINKAVLLIRGQKGTLGHPHDDPGGKGRRGRHRRPLIRGVIKELNVFGDGRPLPPGTKSPDFEAILLPAAASMRSRRVAARSWLSSSGHPGARRAWDSSIISRN